MNELSQCNFDARLQEFKEKVMAQYHPFVCKGGIAEDYDYYIFQTVPKFSPELLIVGINPGGDGKNGDFWLSPECNWYTVHPHYWFQTLRNIFGYPDNKTLSSILAECVGTNQIYINTGNQNKIPTGITSVATLLTRELIDDIIIPKRIVTLGNQPFCAITNTKCECKQFGSITVRLSHRNEIPVARLYNPSKMNANKYYTQEKCKYWQEALEWFISEYK
jgi:hypothetical protein